jgi:hypothetical protein
VSPETFYVTVGTVSFTLLGLWWVVVQTRMPLWQSVGHRRTAYAISLQFLLPGVMSILSLVAPDVPSLWRVIFAVAGGIGLVAAVFFAQTLRLEHDCPRIVRVVEWIVVPVYAVVTVIAIAPEAVRSLGFELTPLQIEGIILAILLFLGVQAAWVLLIEPPVHSQPS